MLALLQDPIWQFVGAVLALLAIGVAVWIYYAQRTRRQLLVESLLKMPLIAMGPTMVQGLKILVNDEPINEAVIILIRVANVGNTPLTASDFESPISLTFASKSKVLYAEVTEAKPPELQIVPSYQDNVVQFERQLLNPGDSFSCRILVQDSKGKYAAAARVVGVTQLETSKPSRIGSKIAAFVWLLVAFGALVLSPKSSAAIPKAELPYLLAAIGALLISLVFAASELYSMFKRFREIALHRKALRHSV